MKPSPLPLAPSPSTAAAARYRVLVVDDDDAMLRSISNVLSDDVDVVTCATAQRALDLLKKTSFHVVCSDFKMPGMDGLQLLRNVSGRPPYTSCLLLTGSRDYRADEAGRHYVLLKPFDSERLIAIVMQLARVAEMKRSVEALTTSVRRKLEP